MGMKYDLQMGNVLVKKDGSDTARVDFAIWDDAAVGQLAIKRGDNITFTLDPGDWPLSKANLKTKAEAEIVVKYPGATSV